MLSLKDKTIELILKSEYSNNLIIFYTIDFIIILIKWIIYCNIINNIYYFIPFVICKITETQNRRRYIFYIRDLLILDIKDMYYNEQMIKYDLLSLFDKKTNPIYEFENKMRNNFKIIKLNIEWGLSQIIKLIQEFFIITYMCISNKMYYSCLALIFVNSIAYIFYVKKKQKINNKKETEIILKNRNHRNKIKVLLPLFENNSIEWDKLNNLYLSQIYNININKNNWRRLHLLISNIRDFNLIILVFSIQYIEIKNIFIIITIFSKISNTIADFANFIDKYSSNQIEYQIYCDIFKEVEFTIKTKEKKIPYKIIIESINININNYFYLKSNIDISIKQGFKYLIMGSSGSGKTTFINALIGKIKGIKLNINIPGNYFWDMVVHNQNDHIDTSTISIKDLFILYGDKFDKKLIDKCCNMCIIDDWIKERNIDMYIKNEFSGGQEKRLQISLNLYKLYINKHKIFILDEPEQGSDPYIAYKMINYILSDTKDITVIMISHLEKIKTKFIWDKIWYIKNGIISD